MIGNATQNFVPIREIRNGVVILNDGNLRILLSSSSINLSLKGDDERMAIINRFQDFLNSLDFNIQIFLLSKKLDIRNYIELLKSREEEVEEDLLKIQIKEYINFIQKFTEEQEIMTKNFYIVIPYDIPNIISNTKKISDVDFMKSQNQLMQRVSIVTSGLTALGLNIKITDTEEVVSLFYKLYNPNELNTPNLNN